MNKCIRMGITASNLSFGEENRRFYGRKLRFTAPLTRRRKTKFPTVKPPIYLPKCQIWMQLSPKWQALIVLEFNDTSNFVDHFEGWSQDYRKSDDCFSPNLISSPWRRYEDYNISFCKQWKFRCHCSYEQWHLNLHCLQRGPSCP